MQTQIYYCAALAYIDRDLDDFQEEYGDLPERVKQAKSRLDAQKAIVLETERILSEVRQFISSSKITIMELKEKEEKLSKQQFMVRNNKEFDAITKEIEHSRQDHNRLIDELRTAGMKEENLIKMLEQQHRDVAEAEQEYEEKESELETISSDQNDEVKILFEKREEYVKKINKEYIEAYDRIRTLHNDAVVRLRKNSCSGCFSAVPPQKIVEIRNNLDDIFTCEQCGRILYPDDIVINDSILD